MATLPLKSQPLHNSPLFFLKWGGTTTTKNNHPSSNHQCFGRPTSEIPPPSPPDHPSEPDSDPPRHESRTSRNNRFVLLPSPKQLSNNDEASDNKKCDTEDAVNEAEETIHKLWNLRPRRLQVVPIIAIGAIVHNCRKEAEKL